MSSIVLRIYGDSLSKPRYFDKIKAEDTYAEILKSKLETKFNTKVSLFNKSWGGVSVKRISESLKDDNNYFADDSIIIFQIGIVDCAPRPVPVFARNAISKFPKFLKKHVVSFLHDNRIAIQKIKYYRITSPKNFKKTYSDMIRVSNFGNNKIFLVNIAPPSEEITNHSPGLQSSVYLYNHIISELSQEHNCKLIDVNSAITRVQETNGKSLMLEDGHHVSREGHILYANLLFDAITETYNKNENKS